MLRQIMFPLTVGLVSILVLGLAEIILLRTLNREWWNIKWVRRSAILLPIFGCLMLALWVVGEMYTKDWLLFPGMVLSILCLILEFCLMISLPLSGFVHFIQWLVDRFSKSRRKPGTDKPDQGRRFIIQAAAAALPVAALSSGLAGVSSAFTAVKVYRIPIHIESLPPALEGLKILHLSDLHLRHYLRLNDLEELLETIEPHAPDLTLVTGDVADDLRLLPDSLSLISQLSPAMGTFGSLGNHEYFRGIKQVRRTFDASPIPLLVNEGLSLEYRGESIFIGGIDDPRHMGAKLPNFYRSSIDQTLVSESGQSLRLLLSHRPDALDYASVAGIDLTLAGHTHGGQIGFGGRSLLEPIWPDRYLWGHYQIGDSHLYTSSGVGHWLPFRLGCPAEAPIIELHRA